MTTDAKQLKDVCHIAVMKGCFTTVVLKLWIENDSVKVIFAWSMSVKYQWDIRAISLSHIVPFNIYI